MPEPLRIDEDALFARIGRLTMVAEAQAARIAELEALVARLRGEAE
jgi:hypothetical protein